MALPKSTVIDIEPTPAFNERCLAIVHEWLAGDLPYADAVTRVKTLHHEAEADNHTANLARAEHILGYIYHYIGNLNISLRHYERSRALYDRVGNRKRVAVMDLNMGETYRYKGDFPRARRLFHAAYETAGELDELETQAMAIANEGQVLLSMHQFDQAREALEEGSRLAKQLMETEPNETLMTLLCEVFHGLTIIYLAEGQTDLACEVSKQALEIANEGQQPMQLGFANRAAGEAVTLIETPLDDALIPDPDEYFRTANQAFREIDMEGEVARTMFAHARSLARRGRRTTAARKLQQVMIIFTRLGMVDDAAKAAELQLTVL